MPAIDELLSQIQQSFLTDFTPTPPRTVSEVGTNQFGLPRHSEGNVVIAYSASGAPLTLKISGGDEDMSIFQQPFIDHVRMIECKDAGTAQKLADILDALFGATLVLDEPNRRRIKRAARQLPTNRDVPPGMIRNKRTGELGARLRPGRRKER